jgi:photosystem II stability/assembly factor-like uncharacterized protein
VNTVNDLRQALSDEVRRLQPPGGLETRVLQQALQRSGNVVPAHRAERRSALPSWDPKRRTELAAGIAAVVLAAIVIGTFAFIRLNTRPIPTPVHPPPFQIRSPGAVGCSSSCTYRPLVFVSTNVGWLIENRGQDPGACSPAPCPIGSVILRTDDGGSHWNTQLSSNSWGQEILASPDGMELLFVPQPDQGAALHRSTDGGLHWTSLSLPTGSGQAVQTGCKLGHCVQQSIGEQVYFVNPREGWLLSQEPTFTVADLFHTTDSGAHWNLTRIDIKAEFGLDLARGLTDTVGNVDHTLYGQVVFNDSANGWFLPIPSWNIYVTHDGGATWHRQSIPRPIGVQSDWGAFVDEVYLFPNGIDGVLSMHVRHAGLIGPAGPQSAPYRYVYTTSDGGDHWSNPTYPPAVDVGYVDVSIAFIDATHWIGWPQPTVMGPTPVGGFMHTSDAGRHWDVLPASSLQVVESFEFLDPLRGWVVGAQSAGLSLYETTDGGASWTSFNVSGLS